MTRELPPIQFHIVHSEEIPRADFLPFLEAVELGRKKVPLAVSNVHAQVEEARTALAHASTEDRQTAQKRVTSLQFEEEEERNKLRGFDKHTPEELSALAKHLHKMGLRTLAHCANGTLAMIFDMTDDQVLRVSVGDERPVEPEFSEPNRVETFGPFKIEIFNKLDFESLNLHTEDLELRRQRADYAAPVVHSLKRRGIFPMDVSGSNNALMKDGSPINGDPGTGAMQIDIHKAEEDLSEHEKLIMPQVWEAQSLPLAIEYAPEDMEGPWSAEDKRLWLQARVYPLIATGKIAGVLSDADLEKIIEDQRIEILRSDGSLYSPKLPEVQAERQRFIENFVGRVKAGEYPLPVLSDLLQGRGESAHTLKLSSEAQSGFAAHERVKKGQRTGSLNLS